MVQCVILRFRGYAKTKTPKRSCVRRQQTSKTTVRNEKHFDVAVIGAGVFGAWTALHLRQRGASVLLVDFFGPGNSRSSSGGESRVIRLGYGADELYTRSARASLTQWQMLFAETGAGLFKK